MHKILRVLSFPLAAGAMLVTPSCGNKSSDPQAQTPTQPQTATISGQITPAGSVTTVTATDASGKTATATPTSTGAYSFTGLTVGAYTLTFTPATGYAAPAPVPVTLASGGTTAPAITSTLATATASFTADGTPVSARYIFSQTLAGNRFLTFTVSPGGAPGPTVSINMIGLIPALGSYSLTNSGSGQNASYTGPDYVQYASDFNTGANLPMGGTLTITAVSATARRFSGTFNFIGIGVNTTPTSPASRNITNGVFSNVPY